MVGRELCEANPCEAGVVGKKKHVEQEWWEENCVKQTLVKQEWWERNAWWSRSGGKETPGGAGVAGKHTLVKQSFWREQFGR